MNLADLCRINFSFFLSFLGSFSLPRFASTSPTRFLSSSRNWIYIFGRSKRMAARVSSSKRCKPRRRALWKAYQLFYSVSGRLQLFEINANRISRYIICLEFSQPYISNWEYNGARCSAALTRKTPPSSRMHSWQVDLATLLGRVQQLRAGYSLRGPFTKADFITASAVDLQVKSLDRGRKIHPQYLASRKVASGAKTKLSFYEPKIQLRIDELFVVFR